ncbi:unnamed protein product [Porites lobata]|uniref:SSD domain-containing protein n=1 Tax=Porites lobata TaxID=104759 RepID=A0ABN8MZV6_9CNID|nr:unnamed protein product [Porites lobata]
MQEARGHSRKESDDFSKLCFGNDSENLESGGEGNFYMDPALEPALSFHQPKTYFTSISFVYALRDVSTTLRLSLIRLYVHPVGAAVVLLAAILIPALLGWRAFDLNYKEKGEYLVIDKSLESFEIPGHITSEHNDLVDVASKLSKESKTVPRRESPRKGRRKRSAGIPDINPKEKHAYPFQQRPKWTLELVYLAVGKDESDLNIFTKERLETIHQIEQNLIRLEDFADFCWKWSKAKDDYFLPNGCTPPISLIDFFFPSISPDLGLRINDGQGKVNLTKESIDQSLKLLLTKPYAYWFVDDSFSKDHRKSRFLRAEIKFGSPLHWKYGYHSKQQSKSFNTFLVKYVEALKKMSTDKVHILYGGNDIFDYEVDKTLWADIRLSIFTMVFVAAFVLVFTRFSLWLTFWGILSLLTPICLAYFFFRVVFEKVSLGILSGISVFIIIGIGVDDVFVFINTFRQAHGAKNLETRIAHTLCTAGKATFFTSFTTAAAFSANCLSEMPAIRDFGLFMALIVSFCWLTVFCTIPPVLNLWQRFIVQWEEVIFDSICGWTSHLFDNVRYTLPDDIVQFLSGNDQNRTASEPSSASSVELELSVRQSFQEEDDDDQLLQLDSNGSNSQSPSPSSSDCDLAMYSDPNGTFDMQLSTPLMRSRTSQSRTTVRQTGQSGNFLQSFLYHWLGVPIKKYPIVVVVCFVMVLVASITLDSMIHASTKPPAFFKESTNLQQLLYLKYNMSSDNLNVNDLGLDIIGNDNVHSNQIPNPKTPKTTATETNGLKSPTTIPSPATAAQRPGKPKSSGIQLQSNPTKSTTSAYRQTTTLPPEKSSTLTLTPGTQKASKSTKKSTSQEVTEPPKTTRKLKQATSKSSTRSTTSTGDTTLPTVCPPGSCKAIDKPLVDTAATVYVIFGLKGIDRSKITREHVIEKKGDVVPDYDFTDLLLNSWPTFLMYACRLCHKLSNNSKLVRPGGADCFPTWIMDYINDPQRRHDDWNKDCLKIKKALRSTGKSRAKLMKMPSKDPKHGNYTYWMKMAFESTVFMGKSSQEKVKDYDNWNNFLEEELKSYPKGLKTAFQTSKEWVMTFMEVIAVNSAIYGIALSLAWCLGLVAIFTANFFLTLIVTITILSVLSTVVAIFYLASWQLGAVEAISLSILVGTSVDYCVHLVEGYIMAGNSIPAHLTSSKEIRGWRSLAAVSHIGTAILSSAVTTIVASIPLCLATIQLFAKFGQILAINTAVSIYYTLTICVALLCLMGPVRFRASWKSSVIALLVVAIVYSIPTLILFFVNWKVVTIPGPAGEPLFPKPN